MYCTRCGAQISERAETCPSCGAKRRTTATPESRSRWFSARIAVAGALAIAALVAWFAYRFSASGGAGATASAPSNGSAPDQNLLAAMPSFRAHAWNAAAETLPSGNMFVLPKVDLGFAGSWGGRVDVLPADRGSVSMPEVPMSYFFGVQSGVLYLQTRVYGDPRWPVKKSAVKVLGPKSIEFKLDSMCSSCTPAVRQQEVTQLTLVDAHTIEVSTTSYAYREGDGSVQATYKGELHPVDQAQLAAIDQEVERHNSLLTTIDSKLKMTP